MRNLNRRIILFLILIGCTLSSSIMAQDKVKWYSLEQAEALNKKERKKIFIDIYTSWCGWCKNMEKATFSQAYIAQYLNNNYYPVKLNAEQHEEIIFKNRTYKFVSQSGVGFNELAAELLRGQMAYPTIVFLDEDLNLIQAIQGYRPPDQFEVIMTYFGEDHHKKTPWQKYEKMYKKR
jgi:thioredoxin-related protein